MITIIPRSTVSGRKLELGLVMADSANLSNKKVTGSIAWGDGELPTDLATFGEPPAASVFPFNHSFEHTYKADGFYLVQVSVANQKAPKPDMAKSMVSVDISTAMVKRQEPAGFVLGPILPSDRGFPNGSQWCFHMGKDTQVLSSNIRLIILTSLGERLMMPGFGTRVRQLVFEKDQRLVESVLKEELTLAIARYEPRVRVDSIAVNRRNDRDVVVSAVFSPKDDLGGLIELNMDL